MSNANTRLSIVIAGVMVAGLCAALTRFSSPSVTAAVVAAPEPVAAASDPNEEWFVSPMRVREEKPMSYLAMTRQTSYEKISKDAPEMIMAVQKAIAPAHAHTVGTPITVYNSEIATSMKESFTLDAGWPVADGAADAGEATVRSLPAFKCACVVFGGPLPALGRAYESVLKDIAAAGLEPTDERRERHLVFNGPNADDNVVMIEIGVK